MCAFVHLFDSFASFCVLLRDDFSNDFTVLLPLLFTCRCRDSLCVCILFIFLSTNMHPIPTYVAIGCNRIMLFVHLFDSFTYSLCVVLCEVFERFLTMIFHLIMLHSTDYYICILYTVYYILLPMYIHIPTLYVYGFLIVARSLFLAVAFPVAARLF